MYDGESMKKHIKSVSEFNNITILPAGKTLIQGETGIDFYYKKEDSVYLECFKQ